MGVPQGLVNNLEDLQCALEGLTEVTAQEREDNTAARAQNEALQSAINGMQVQMASVGPGGPAINAMQMHPPPQAHIQEQQIAGRHYNNYISAPPSAPPNQWPRHSHSNGSHSSNTPSNVNNINSREVVSSKTEVVFSKGDAAEDEATWAPMKWFSTKRAATSQGATKCNAYNSSNNNRAGINNNREDTNILHKYNTVASILSLPTTHIFGHMCMGLVHSITA